MSKTWLITGCSSGFGSEIAIQALNRGDTVVATARNPAKIEHLKALGAHTLALDVTAADTEIEKVVAEAIKLVGHIDILMNNAGVILEGAVEECSTQEVKDHFNVNVFGLLAVTRAVLPSMRARRSGVIAGMGSIGGRSGGAGCGLYCSTKFALTPIFQALREENAHLGIEAILIEPGYFRTDFLTAGNKVTAEKVIDDLLPVMQPMRDFFRNASHKQPGDPVKGAALIVEVLTHSGRCKERELPVRLGLGSDFLNLLGQYLEKDRKEVETWKDLTVTTDYDN